MEIASCVGMSSIPGARNRYGINLLAWKDLFSEMMESETSTLYVVFGTMMSTIGNGSHTVGANLLPMRCRRGSGSFTRTKSPILKFAGSRLAL